ncbi:hypothetical protein [Pyrobaculum islandicum]|uniref:hypothetical protein n=1 Tax=Pyrobaculum islandicum TaxID=2277 RepID=UPI00069D9D16|nr:hypothetical protein [Pyrobaculum islandicum]
MGTTITPEVAPAAVWNPFPIRYTFAGWAINGVVTKSIAVTGPVEAEAVWTLDPTPAVALAVGAVVAGVAVAYTIRRAKRTR